MLGQAYKLSREWDRALLYCEKDLEQAMLKDPPDFKAAAAFATLSGEARQALGQRDSAVEMFQQAINIARVALDPMGEVLAFSKLVLAMTSHVPDEEIFPALHPIRASAAAPRPRRRVRLLRLEKKREQKAIRLLLPPRTLGWTSCCRGGPARSRRRSRGSPACSARAPGAGIAAGRTGATDRRAREAGSRTRRRPS